MIYINILTGFNHYLFIHQLDRDRFKDKIMFFENSNEKRIWDYVVVFERIKDNISFKCKKGGLIFITGEPPMSNPYSPYFFAQFDSLITVHPLVKHKNNILSQTSLNWHFGFSFTKKIYKYGFDDLKRMSIPDKSKNISMICSSKKMIPGHIRRYHFYEKLKKDFDGKIDFFGDGIKFIDDKSDAILPYRFHICIENSNNIHYWTEKIADSILGFSVPIYCGAPNISNYFPKEAMYVVDINQYENVKSIISEILRFPEKYYNEKLPYLIQARDMLLNKYNIFPMLETFIEKNKIEHSLYVEVKLKPLNKYMDYKIKIFFLRGRRKLYKILNAF